MSAFSRTKHPCCHDKCGLPLNILKLYEGGLGANLDCCTNSGCPKYLLPNFICTRCSVTYQSRKSLIRHYKSDKHISFGEMQAVNSPAIDDDLSLSLSDISPPIVESVLTNSEHFTSNASYLEHIVETTSHPSPEVIIKTFSARHQQYYNAAINQRLGPNYLVNLALTRNPRSYNSCTDSSAMYTLLVMHLTKKMTIPDREIFSSILSFVAHNERQQVIGLDNSAPSVSESLYIPKNAPDIRQTLFEGVTSLQNNLPLPDTRLLDNKFVYIPLMETIRNQFATENPPHPFLPFDNDVHASSPRGQELLASFLESPVNNDPHQPMLYPLKLILWCDGFQCFNFSVDSDASAHACYATIGAKDGDHSGKFTFLVWLGPQNVNTDEVECMLVNEINDLNDNDFFVYHNGLQRIVNIRVELYAFLCDRPDKGKRLNLLTGGNYCPRFGFSGDHNQIIEKIVCCDNCFDILRNNKSSSGSKSSSAQQQCSNGCFAFDYRLMEFKPPPEFPDELTNENKNISVMPLTFVTLQAAVKKGFESIRDGVWTTQLTLTSFLRSQGINTALMKVIYHNGRRAHSLRNELRRSKMSKVELEATDQHNRDCPEMYTEPVTPAMWRLPQLFDVTCFIDCPMHLLFLGTHKAVSKNLLSQYLTGVGKMASFTKKMNTKLDAVASLNISYLNIVSSAGTDKLTYGNWLSRHLMTHARLTKWLHNHIGTCSVTQKDTKSGYPDHQYYYLFNVNEIDAFCKERGIPITCKAKDKPTKSTWFMESIMVSSENMFGHYMDKDIIEYVLNHSPVELENCNELSVVERRQAFFQYVKTNKLVPPAVAKEFEVTAKESDVVDVVSLDLCVISRVMSGTDRSNIQSLTTDLERYIKMFLTMFHKVDQGSNGSSSKKKPMLTALRV